jgi:hypothetical protein
MAQQAARFEDPAEGQAFGAGGPEVRPDTREILGRDRPTDLSPSSLCYRGRPSTALSLAESAIRQCKFAADHIEL